MARMIEQLQLLRKAKGVVYLPQRQLIDTSQTAREGAGIFICRGEVHDLHVIVSGDDFSLDNLTAIPGDP